jgi:hypothetical protein
VRHAGIGAVFNTAPSPDQPREKDSRAMAKSKNTPPPAVVKRVRQLHAMIGTGYPNERATACSKLDKLLAKHGLTWNDLPELLHADETKPEPPSFSDAADDNVAAPTAADAKRAGLSVVDGTPNAYSSSTSS